MLKAILRTTLFAGAAYGAYMLAKKYYPSQVDSALDSAKSFGNDTLTSAKNFASDSVKNLADQGKNIASPAKDARRAV